MKLGQLRAKKRPIYIEGVRLDGLLLEQPLVYDPTTSEQRNSLTAFRGVHLGKLACNILRHNPVLNAGEDKQISFSSYSRARWAAESMTSSEGTSSLQFTQEDREFLKNRVGLDLPRIMPAMIVALRPDIDLGPLVDIERYEHLTPISELEENSKKALVSLFELNE